jgi:hypothetical protein
MNHADVKKPWEASSVANAFPIFQTKGYEGLLKDIYSEIIPNDAKSHFDLANPEHQGLKESSPLVKAIACANALEKLW